MFGPGSSEGGHDAVAESVAQKGLGPGIPSLVGKGDEADEGQDTGDDDDGHDPRRQTIRGAFITQADLRARQH